MFLAEVNGVAAHWLCGIGSAFVVARALYVLGMLTRPTSMPMRIGAGGTYLLEIVLLSLLLGARLG